MTETHKFICDSCKLSVNAEYNGEHFLPPKGWVDVVDPHTLVAHFHLCVVCRDTAVSVNLRDTKTGKLIDRSIKDGPKSLK